MNLIFYLLRNPNLLLNHPKDKTVIKFETEYNQDIKNIIQLRN